MNNKEQPISSVEKMAEEYADKTFKIPLNSKGEEMVQRVGQNPHGYRKHVNEVKKHFIEGYKANNHLEELEKWVKENFMGDIPTKILVKIAELKSKK
jgi:hypothetical protein